MPVKLKAAMELDIVHCGYFTIGIPTVVTWAGSVFLSFCLIFSNFPRQRKITHVSSPPCCNLKWKYRLDFAYHGIFTSETSIENVMNVSLYMYVLISRTWKCHFATKLKTRFCLSHLIKGEWLMFSLRQYCPDFSIFPMFTFEPHLLLTISRWNRANIGTQGVQEIFFCEVSGIGAFLELFTVMVWLIWQVLFGCDVQQERNWEFMMYMQCYIGHGKRAK